MGSAGNILTLTCVFREYLNATSTPTVRVRIPLEISVCLTEDSVNLIAHELVRTEDMHGMRVFDQDLIKKFLTSLETALLRPFVDSKGKPVRKGVIIRGHHNSAKSGRVTSCCRQV